MASDEKIEELLQALIKTISNWSYEDIGKTIEVVLSSREDLSSIVSTSEELEELKNNMRLYYLRMIEMCKKYNSKDINLYLRFKELSEKMNNYNKYYFEDEIAYQRDAIEMKELIQLVQLALGEENGVSKAIDWHFKF